MRQICQAINEIHSCQIIHRDLKPENIVIHDVKILLFRILSNYVTLDGLFIWIKT